MSGEVGGVDDEEEGSQVVLPPRIVSDDEACRQLNQEELLARVRYLVCPCIIQGCCCKL